VQEARRSVAKPGKDADEQLRQTTEEARILQEQWGCPGGGFGSRPLDKDFATTARHFARIVGLYRGPEDQANVPTGCPFQPIMVADEYTLEITEAVCHLGIDGGYRDRDFAALLGREVTAMDLDAYKTWSRALKESMASDRELERATREAADKRKGGK
jgi:hypothetical protein